MLDHYLAAKKTTASNAAQLILVAAMYESGMDPIVPSTPHFRLSLNMSVSEFERALGELVWRGYLEKVQGYHGECLWFTYDGGPEPTQKTEAQDAHIASCNLSKGAKDLDVWLQGVAA